MKLAINNQIRELDVTADTTILEYLRSNGLKGTKEGCASGDCGACTVMIGRLAETDGTGEPRVHFETVNACIAPIGQYAGTHIVTVEGLGTPVDLHPAQQEMVNCHGSQCGFCTPGFVVSLATLVENGEAPDRGTVEQGISGNLCRCTGYRPIVEAGMKALEADPTELLHDTAIFASLQDRNPGPVRFPENEVELREAMRKNPGARLIAGCTDLMLEVTQLDRDIPSMIDVSRVTELRQFSRVDDYYVMGSAVTYTELESAFADLSRPFVDMLHRLGSRQIRNGGTPGGNLANGSPIADMPPVLIAWDAEIELVSLTRQTRRMPIVDFYEGYRQTVLADHEYIARIHIPVSSLEDFHRFYKSSKRIEDDISSVMGAFRFRIEDNQITEACIGFGGMAATPVRVENAEAELVGKATDDDAAINAACAALDSAMSPLTDVRASKEYRSAMAKTQLIRALREAGGRTCPTVMELNV